MPSRAKISSVEENDSDEPESCFDFMEGATGGMDSDEESELGRLEVAQTAFST